MRRSRVFVTRAIPDIGLALIRDFCEADIWPEEIAPTPEDLIKHARNVEGLLTLLTDKIDLGVMDASPRLKVISNMAVGVDNVDIAAATARKIPVGNTPGVLTDATADMTFALLLAAARHIVEGEKYVRAGNWKSWNPNLLLGADFAGRTLGIIGFGRIGQAVARRAQGFNLRVLFHDPTADDEFGAKSVDLDTLLVESDFISLHVPLTPHTHHLIDKAAIDKMKPHTILVNTARGSIVDPGALYAALKSHQISAAALDVTEPEPLPVDSPLLQLDNCLIVPHLGSASRQTRDKMALLAAENLIAGLRGERLPHCVNPAVYEK